jgi:hypothetical protein
MCYVLRWRRVVLASLPGPAVTLVWVLVTPPTFKARTSPAEAGGGGLGGLTSLLSSRGEHRRRPGRQHDASNDAHDHSESRFLRERSSNGST